MATTTGSNDNKSNGGSPPKPLDRKGSSNLAGEAIEDEAPPPPPTRGSPPSGGGRSPTNGRPPLLPAPPTHHRGVSTLSDLSLDTPAAPGDRKVVSDILEQVSTGNNLETASRGVQRQLTLADIKGASPMEAEAETLLLQALEERDNKPELAPTILPDVPNEGMAAFEAEPVEPLPDGDDGEEQQFHEAADEVRSSDNSTKMKLVGLTNAMRLLQKDKTVDTLNVDEKVGDIQGPEEQDIPASDANTFLNNANILFRRSSTTKENKETNRNEEVLPSSSGENHDMEEGGSLQPNRNSQTKSKRRRPTYKAKNAIKDARVGVTAELTTWHDFVEPKKTSAWKYAKFLTCALILPLFIIAVILFYATDNPMVRDTGASVSWVCLFILRNLITFSLAKLTEVVIIDYLSLRRRFTVNVSLR